MTLGSDTGKGGFFPDGLNGKITKPTGYNVTANARGGYPGNSVTVQSLAATGRGFLLGNDTLPVPPPPAPSAVQAEASGVQYGSDFTQQPSGNPSDIYPAGESKGLGLG